MRPEPLPFLRLRKRRAAQNTRISFGDSVSLCLKSDSKMTNKPSFAITIMAAGKGTRLKSKHPKVLHEIGGKPLLRHVIESAAKVVPMEDVYAIIGYEAENVRKAMSGTGAKFILQEEQRGTGHAI